MVRSAVDIPRAYDTNLIVGAPGVATIVRANNGSCNLDPNLYGLIQVRITPPLNGVVLPH